MPISVSRNPTQSENRIPIASPPSSHKSAQASQDTHNQDELWARGKGMAHPQQANSTVVGLTCRRWRWCVQPVLLSLPCVNTEQALEPGGKGSDIRRVVCVPPTGQRPSPPSCTLHNCTVHCSAVLPVHNSAAPEIPRPILSSFQAAHSCGRCVTRRQS